MKFLILIISLFLNSSVFAPDITNYDDIAWLDFSILSQHSNSGSSPFRQLQTEEDSLVPCSQISNISTGWDIELPTDYASQIMATVFDISFDLSSSDNSSEESEEVAEPKTKKCKKNTTITTKALVATVATRSGRKIKPKTFFE